MALPLAPIASGAMVVIALIVLLARGLNPTSVTLASLLALWGAGSAANAILITTVDPARAVLAANLSLWYSLPISVLLLASASLIVDGRWPRGRARWGLLGVGAITLFFLVAFALDHETLVRRVARFGDGHALESGPMLYFLTMLIVAAEAATAWFGSERARDASLSEVVRERAFLVCVATAILALHVTGFFVVFVLLDPTVLGQRLIWFRILATFSAGAVALVAILRASRAPTTRGRSWGLGAAGLAIVLGVVDGLVRMGRFYGFSYPGYDTSLLLVRIAFAALLGLAVLRFGLADAGVHARRLVERVSTASVAVALMLAVAGVALLALGATSPGLAVGGILAVTTPVLLRRTLETSGRQLARRVLLAPDDPRAVAERARTYTSAVAASKGAGAEGERYLADLREDLGISEREHALLVQGLASRDVERYRPVETLGRGATAQVELAVDEVAGTRVVVKRFRGLRDPAAALKEARALAAVKHPRVIPFLEVDRRGDELYLVLAYAEGGSARQLLDREGPLPAARAVAIASDLLEGLEALHAAGVVHCDVKAENVLLGADGRGLLGDFGSARFVAPDVADATLTGAAAEGSLSTISPEALRGAPPAPARDVYAAGAVLYRLLTGEHYVALADATVFEARERIFMDAPRLPHPRVPAAVAPVLRKALAKKIEERYRSAREMREALAIAATRATA